MANELYFDEQSHAWEEEGLFARDMKGQLIRVVSKTEEDYTRYVTVTIDGEEINVPRAVPTTDAQGNILYQDAAGRTIPRATTILDAVNKLRQIKEFAQNPDRAAMSGIMSSLLSRGSLSGIDLEEEEAAPPIPTLCHQDHLKPVGVCRVCSVAVETYEVDRKDPTKRTPKRQEKLVPACIQPVEDNMVVYTMESSDAKQRGKVEASVKVLLELLAADHLPQQVVPLEDDGDLHDAAPTMALSASKLSVAASDLERLLQRYGGRLGIDPTRYRRREKLPRPVDDSSPLIRFDPNACILCDRCSRACGDVKQNFIIGRAEKGYEAHISFDLGKAMGDSNCVECGECMLSCPTTALTFRHPVESDWYRAQIALPGRSAVTPIEMEQNDLLRTLPWRYRQWNQSSLVRWRVKKGDQLAKVGDYGSTAFILNSGKFGVWLPRRRADGGLEKGWDQGEPTFTMGADAVILGEMTILNLYPRSATVRALSDGEVYEVRRNILFALQRNPGAREILNAVYRSRALNTAVKQASLFDGLSAVERETCLELLGRDDLLKAEEREEDDGLVTDESSILGSGTSRSLIGSTNASVLGGSSRSMMGSSAALAGTTMVRPKRRGVELITVEPGQVIFRQGEPADCFYMIYIGHVKVSQTYGGQERVLDYLRPDRSFGEIALLAEWDEIREAIPPEFRGRFGNRRTTTCTALDDVTLVRIDAPVFRRLLARVPTLKNRLIQQAKNYLAESDKEEKNRPLRAPSPAMAEFTDQGLFNAQRLLVLDLEACTRCDECTKACSDTHQGITRLIREGLRFDKWLVASSCRSCTDPYCLVGCPVDAIHRVDPYSAHRPLRIQHQDGGVDSRRIEIQIEDNCIGCGLCANNCPYGNINMHGSEHYDREQRRAVVEYQATTCDLCGDYVGNQWREVSCVYACPHHAAHRVKGEELLDLIKRR